MSLGETLMRPTVMLFRNLMIMEVEGTLRANSTLRLAGRLRISARDEGTPR